MPRRLIGIIIVLGMQSLSAAAYAAELLIERAPKLDSLHLFLAAEVPDDEEDRRELEQKRITSLHAIEQQLYSTSPNPKRLNQLYEAATLRLEQALTRLERAQNHYTQEYDAYFIGTMATPPTLALDGYREELLRAVNHLREFQAQTTRKNSRYDEVNFLIASTLSRVGNEHCEVYFKQAIEHSTKLEWKIKARIARADYLVSKQRYSEATQLYLKDFKQASDALKSYINYRLSWLSLHKNWNKDQATRQEAVVTASKALSTTFNGLSRQAAEDRRIDLRTRIAQDLLWLWALANNQQEAIVFLKKFDLEEMETFYWERLGREQINRREIHQARATFAQILNEDPEIEQAPDYHFRLANGYYLTGNIAAVKQEIVALETMVKDKNNPWFEAYEDDKPRFERAQRMLALLPLSGGMTLARAAEAEKSPTRKAKLLDSAITELKGFVRANPQHPQVPSVRLALVSALIQSDRNQEALSELDQLYRLSGLHDPQREAIVSERLRLVIKLDEAQKYPALPAPGAVVRPIALPELKQRFATYVEDYLKVIPDAEQVALLRYQVAQNLFLYGHYADAMLQFEALVNDFPATIQAKTGIEVLLSMNLKLGRWDELIRLSTSFLNNRAVKGKSLRDYVKENLDYARSKKSS